MKKVIYVLIVLSFMSIGIFSYTGLEGCNNGGGEDIPCECANWKDAQPADGCCDNCGHVYSHCVHHGD